MIKKLSKILKFSFEKDAAPLFDQNEINSK